VNISDDVNLPLSMLANMITQKAHRSYSSHRERSHHRFYDGVGGLRQAIVPVGAQELRQLAALHVVLFRARAHARLRRGGRRFYPLREGDGREF